MDVASFSRIRKPWRKWDVYGLRRNLGVYVHVPFCLARCRYCDFLTFGEGDSHAPDPERYADALAREIRHRGDWAVKLYGQAARRVDTVFFGGGTPTYLSAAGLCRLVRAARESFDVAGDAEITVEANPETLSADYLEMLAEAGVNRLSVGVQAYQDRHLKFLGRVHRARRTARQLELASASGIKRLSFDLIYAVPGLTMAELSQSISWLMSYKPEHLSCYELTIEPGTPLARWAKQFPGRTPGPDEAAQQQQHIRRRLAGFGLYQYEVSNYCLPGRECWHNLRYWQGGDYIGLGLGAASRIGEEVINNPRNMAAYLAMVEQAGSLDDPLAKVFAELQKQVIPGASAPPADEFLQLRTGLGTRRDGVIKPEWITKGLVRPVPGGIEVSPRGLRYSDMLARER